MKIIPDPAPRRHNDFTLAMINIVFLLLLFFLTTGSLSNRQEAQSTVPVTRDLPLERLPRPLLLLEADGTLLLDGQPVPRAGLIEAARKALAATGRTGTALSLLAQRDMPAAPFLAIAEALRANDVPLQIVTLHEPEGRAAAP
jgi:biopolymer transport protein ExbD